MSSAMAFISAINDFVDLRRVRSKERKDPRGSDETHVVQHVVHHGCFLVTLTEPTVELPCRACEW